MCTSNLLWLFEKFPLLTDPVIQTNNFFDDKQLVTKGFFSYFSNRCTCHKKLIFEKICIFTNNLSCGYRRRLTQHMDPVIQMLLPWKTCSYVTARKNGQIQWQVVRKCVVMRIGMHESIWRKFWTFLLFCQTSKYVFNVCQCCFVE